MIAFNRISKQYGKQVLFVDASFQLNPGEKVGLVGPNGSGKTTLFRLIVGEESADDGEVSVPKKLTIGYFRQDIEEMAGRSVLDEVIAGSGRARTAATCDGRPRAGRGLRQGAGSIRRGAGRVRAPGRLRAREPGA
jgi:ATPase subunit of ABC transporter with duplicated ATPase domains